jgi:hypothetical protein
MHPRYRELSDWKLRDQLRYSVLGQLSVLRPRSLLQYCEPELSTVPAARSALGVVLESDGLRTDHGDSHHYSNDFISAFNSSTYYNAQCAAIGTSIGSTYSISECTSYIPAKRESHCGAHGFPQCCTLSTVSATNAIDTAY